MSDRPPQRFDLTVPAATHRVEISDGALRREIRWYVDDELVGGHQVGRREGDAQAGGPRARPARPAVLDARPPAPGHAGSSRARRRPRRRPSGIGGIDLDPEPGSRAAAYEQKVREHPRRYAAIQTAGGVAKVVRPAAVPLPGGAVHVLAAAARREPARIPRPDLPDLPSIPWPDINLAGLVAARLGARGAGEGRSTCWPVVLAFVLARAEIRRRRKQDELKAGLRQQDERDDA